MTEEQVNKLTELLNSIRVAQKNNIGRSFDIKELAEALSQAQGEMPLAIKKSENPYYSNLKRRATYADLAEIVKTSAPILSRHGLSITQFPIKDGNRVGVRTMLLHKSGQFIEGDFLLTPTKEQGKDKGGNPIGEPYLTPQKETACVTYARRCVWQSVIGMAADDDDDGNSASGVDEKNEKPETKPFQKTVKPAENKEENPNDGIVITKEDEKEKAVNDLKVLYGRFSKDNKKQGELSKFILANYAPADFNGKKVSEFPTDLIVELVNTFDNIVDKFTEAKK